MPTATIDLKNLDKSTWQTYRFDEIAKNISERIDPNNTDLEVYIGLEHIDSESLHIRRFGSPGDVKGQKLKFYKGDIIFGRRRAYQRKAAIATTDGFCSAHALVLRANPDLIDPQLFPFFMHSDQFMNRAVDISVGSLSPTINWGTLKQQEFLLPPKAQQAELAELLWALDEAVELTIIAESKVSALKSAYQRYYFNFDDDETIEIETIAKVYSGGTPNRKKPEFWGGSIPWIKTAEVNYNIILETEESITEMGLEKSAAKLIPKRSILLAMYGQGVTRGRVALTGIAAACNQACAVIEVKDDFVPEFIYYYLEYKYEEIRELAHGANQQNLNLGMVKNFRIPKIKEEEQREIVATFNKIFQTHSSQNYKRATGYTLQKSLINQIF